MNLDSYTYLFLKTNIWLCFTSLLMVLASALALSVPIRSVGIAILLPPLLFYFIYIEERRDVSSEDWINHPLRTQLVQQYQLGLLFSEIIALAAYEALLIFEIHTTPSAGVVWIVFGQIPVLVLIVYGQLKTQPMLDSIAVGFTWAFAVVATILISTASELSLDILLVFIAWFLIVFAGAESRNINDIQGDKHSAKVSLAELLGKGATKMIERGLKMLGVILFWYISNIFAAGVVVFYLFFLRLFRHLADKVEITDHPVSQTY